MEKEREGVLGTAKVKVMLSKVDDDVVRAKHRGGRGHFGAIGNLGHGPGLSPVGWAGLWLMYAEGQSGRMGTVDTSLCSNVGLWEGGPGAQGQEAKTQGRWLLKQQSLWFHSSKQPGYSHLHSDDPALYLEKKRPKMNEFLQQKLKRQN